MIIKVLMKQLEVRRIGIGKERDRLRDFISQAEELEEMCARAYDAIDDAIDHLSEMA